MNIPNSITLLRIFLVPVLGILFYLPYKWNHLSAGIVFLLAAITDWLDGYLARCLKENTAFGTFLDPVADKLMISSTLIILVQECNTLWVTLPTVVIISRELVMSALRQWMSEIGAQDCVKVSSAGKLKTAVQMLAVSILLIFSNSSISPNIILIGYLTIGLASILSLYSIGQYLKNFIKYMKREGK